MEGYGPATSQVERLLARVGSITLDEAVDLYEAYAARMLIHGWDAERLALARARRAASSGGLAEEYDRARHDAATAWRHALPDDRGPWLFVGRAIANAGGELVVHRTLDEKHVQMLIGPWRMAMGSLEPVGPGISTFAAAGVP